MHLLSTRAFVTDWLGGNLQLRRFRIPEYAFAERPTLVRYPEPGFVSKVLNRAAACDLEREGECSWNVEVHHPILSWVCRPDDVAGLVDFRYWWVVGTSVCVMRSSSTDF